MASLASVPRTRPSDRPAPRARGRLGRPLLVLGAASIALDLLGTLAIQLVYALGGGDAARACLSSFERGAPGAESTCRIVAAAGSPAQTLVLALAGGLGAATLVAALAYRRRADTREARRRCVAGAVLAFQGLLLCGFLLWFRSGELQTFAFQFLNVAMLEGYGSAFLTGAKNTVVLAVLGESGGLAIGLAMALLSTSDYKSVRAPARIYVNFFRGTPLIWQLSVFYFGLSLGLGLSLSSYETAILVFCLNIGAYSAEVFRAGIGSIEEDQLNAARGLGFSQLQAMRYVIVPQAFRRVIPPLLNEFVGLIKDTSLIVVLGLSFAQRDLFATAADGYSTTFNATFYVAAAVGYLAITLPLIRGVGIVEKRMRGGLRGVGG